MENDQIIRETYRLAQENNRMLKSMRRSAFWGGILRLAIYAAFLIVPLWFYLSYMAPVLQDMMNTVDQIQGTGARAQAQFTGIKDMWAQFQELTGSGE